jgi:hypothetical protein
VHGAVGAGRSLACEARLGAGAHGLKVDPDSGERLAVEVGDQASPGPSLRPNVL